MVRRLLALVVVLAMLIPAGTVPAVAQTETCTTTVTYDEFQHDTATIEDLANASSATVTKQNTRVTIDETDAFYRVQARNPNGYCVAFIVDVSEKAMSPAQMPGTVDSTDGNISASWDAHHDFEADETKTRIKFVLPADTTAEFAPNKMRVQSLSWATSGTTKAEGVWESLKTRFSGEETVAKRHYSLSVEKSGQTVQVPLRNPETGAAVSEHDAMYTTDGGETWRPVGTDTDAPVYKTTLEDESAIRFTFVESSAEVEFTVNPTMTDNVRTEYRSYMAGVSDMLDRFSGGLFG